MKELFSESSDNLETRIGALETAFLNLMNDSLERKYELDYLSKQIIELQMSQKQTDERLDEAMLLIKNLKKDNS